MNKSLTTFLLLITASVGFSWSAAVAQQTQTTGPKKTLDRIVAVVNDHAILKSDIDQRVTEYMINARQRNQQQIQFSKALWYSILENEVEKFVLLDKAKEDSVTVTDEEVDRLINQQIDRAVNQLGSEQAVEQQMGKSIVQLRADLRQSYRQERIVQKYRQQKMQDVQITRPEVKEYFNQIPQDSLPAIPEQVAVSQIVKIPPPLKNAQQEAYQLAKQLRDSIVNHGKSIEELARKYSDDEQSASNGGKLPLISLDDLVPEYSAAASALEPGEISEVVKTSFGYHIIRLNRQVGDKIDTNHILIKIDEGGYNSQAAIDSLKAIRDSVLSNPDVTFAEMARKYSEDPNTAPNGGKLVNPQDGSRYFPLSNLDPALYRIVLLLDEAGDISQPKPFNTGSGNSSKQAYRIVRLDDRIQEHTASLEQDYQRIQNIALQEKRFKAMRRWIDKLKDQVFIEYKIPVPDQIAQKTQP